MKRTPIHQVIFGLEQEIEYADVTLANLFYAEDTGNTFITNSSGYPIVWKQINSETSVLPYIGYATYLEVSEDSQSSGDLVIGESYVMNSKTGGDFANVGFVAQYVPFVAIATTPTSWGLSVALTNLTTSTVTSTEMSNTTGETITWSWSPGYPSGIITNEAYTTDKTFIMVGGGSGTSALTSVSAYVSSTSIATVNPQSSEKIFVEIRIYP